MVRKYLIGKKYKKKEIKKMKLKNGVEIERKACILREGKAM